jgi:hypothetical protein
MAWRIADYPARSRLSLVPQKWVLSAQLWRVREERREIIGEDERIVVLRIPGTAGAFVARAEVACWIVARALPGGWFFHSTPPRAQSAVRRNLYPLSRERVVASVRVFV